MIHPLSFFQRTIRIFQFMSPIICHCHHFRTQAFLFFENASISGGRCKYIEYGTHSLLRKLIIDLQLIKNPHDIMIRTINCEGSRRSSHTNARTDFLAIPRNGTNQSVSHVRLDGRECKQAKELIIYSQRTLSVLTDLLPNPALYPMSKNTANIHEIISFPVAAPTIDSNGKMHDGILLHRIACNRHKHPNGLHTDRLHRPIFAPKNDAYDARKAKKHIEKDFVSILSGMDINKPDDAGQAGVVAKH